MLLFQCDRCKKIDHKTLNDSRCPRASIIIQQKDHPNDPLDICNDCYNSFLYWKNPPPNCRETPCL